MPIIVKGSRAQIVGAYIQRSQLWHSVKILKLTENMQLFKTHMWRLKGTLLNSSWKLDMENTQMSLEIQHSPIISNALRTLFLLLSLLSILE